MTSARPVSSSMMLLGLMSRWMIPALCAAPSARATCLTTWSDSVTVNFLPLRICPESGTPFANCMAIQQSDWVCPAAWTWTTFGWSSFAAAFASRRKRST